MLQIVENLGSWGRRTLVWLVASLVSVPSHPSFAQIIPDSTLGSQQSSIIENQIVVNGLTADLIEGGARRGAALFHSFSEFNIGAGEGVYFANPAGIAAIFSRVTGSNPSEIFGTLGVNGTASLIFLNPNGITFGPDAQLDIRGSFVASTANSVIFENGVEFSATHPEAPPLLTINLTPGLQYGSNAQGAIANSGNLVVGQNLTLASAGNLDLQGQLQAGGNLTLSALDTVKVRDSVANPFIAAAMGQLLVQGNQSVDIFALNHPDSGLFSGGDMVLRSTHTVAGDAHYWSGGNFQIRQLDGSLGNLLSLSDPVIRSLGDVRFESYLGASLHILAAGQVEIPGIVQITGSDPVNGLVETVVLSDGTSVFIDGKQEPTLDIRVGMATAAVGSTSFNPGDFFPSNFNNFLLNPFPGTPPDFSSSPTSADIKIGTIAFSQLNGTRLVGTVLLTNQDQPNPLLSGNIQVVRSPGTLIPELISMGGGSVTIDSRGSITIDGEVNTVALSDNDTYLGNGGDVTLIADGNITFANGSRIDSIGISGGNITLKSDQEISATASVIGNLSYSNVPGLKGGDINVMARTLSLINGSTLLTEATGQTVAGNITINIGDTITIDGIDNGELTGVFSVLGQGDKGQSGEIHIQTGALTVRNGGQVSTGTAGQGNSGRIKIEASGAVLLQGVRSNGQPGGIQTLVGPVAEGNGGDIEITAESLTIQNGAQLASTVLGQGNTGRIKVQTDGPVLLEGISNNNFPAPAIIRSNIATGAVGNGSPIEITAESLTIQNGGQITASTVGRGNGGEIDINVREGVTLSGFVDASFNGVDFGFNSAISSQVAPGAVGDGGTIKIKANSLSLSDGGIENSTAGQGDAGDISIQVDEFISLAQSVIGSNVVLGGVGNGGNIDIEARSLTLTEGAQIAAALGQETSNGSGGNGQGGTIQITASDFVSISGVKSAPPAITNLLDPSQIIQVTGFSSGLVVTAEKGTTGPAGSIIVNTDNFHLADGGIVAAFTANSSEAGDITINTNK